MKKTVIRFGLYGALTICILFLASWFLLNGLPYDIQEILGYASMVISLSFIYFGIKHYRDKENGAKIGFGKALTLGVLISLITALAFGILDVIYTELLNPSFMDDYYSRLADELRTSQSEEGVAQQLADLEAQREMFSNPLLSFALMSMTVFVIGFIISLLSALILQRK